MVDWSAVVIGPTVGIFGQPVTYVPAAGSPIASAGPFDITGVFDEGYATVGELGEPGITSAQPRLGVQLSQFPAGFDPELAQGDRFIVKATGLVYVVKVGKADSHGGARLDANLA